MAKKIDKKAKPKAPKAVKPKSKKVVRILSRPLPKTPCCTSATKDGSAFLIPSGFVDVKGMSRIGSTAPITNVYNYYTAPPMADKAFMPKPIAPSLIEPFDTIEVSIATAQKVKNKYGSAAVKTIVKPTIPIAPSLIEPIDTTEESFVSPFIAEEAKPKMVKKVVKTTKPSAPKKIAKAPITIEREEAFLQFEEPNVSQLTFSVPKAKLSVTTPVVNPEDVLSEAADVEEDAAHFLRPLPAVQDDNYGLSEEEMMNYATYRNLTIQSARQSMRDRLRSRKGNILQTPPAIQRQAALDVLNRAKEKYDRDK